VTLSEEDGMRYLHFGTEWIQGGMRIARPWQLELEYQRQMMGVALFVPEPGRVLQLGLGAGALTKFCRRHVTSASLTVVELSVEVIEAARQWFAVPVDDELFQVVPADAREYLATLPRSQRVDWLQVDLYDAAARGPVHDDVDFYRLCRRALLRTGVACFNLFGSRFEPSFRAIATAFDDRLLAAPPVDEGNRIVFALAAPFDLAPEPARQRAAALQAAWRLPFSRWLAGLQQANGLGERLRA
jgi:spermidine synthase